MDALTTTEQTLLQSYEAMIHQSLDAALECWNALLQIRNQRLYRTEFGTFEEYCQAKWNLTRRRVNQMIVAAEFEESLGTTVPKPENERQIRPLAKLEPNEQADAWQEAVETAEQEGKPVAARHVAEVVERRLAEKAEDPEPAVIRIGPQIEGAPHTNDLATLAGMKFGTIYADPPWRYDNKATRANVEDEYEGTMSVDEICAMPIESLAADDAHLHLWTTNAFLQDAFRVMAAWGFEYRSVFVWVKSQMGIGNYWRVSHEFMLLGIRGNAKRFDERCHKSWLQADRTRHSAKPDEVRRIIERVSPGPERLELFGRKPVAGWMVYGNEVDERRLFA